jgi:glycosyltransferase involved in cell wall biosynthesis
MRRPLVSVVMPARNAEETIGYAIASVVEQTMPNLELIVVDDTSTDATAEVVRRVKDARVKLLRAEGNVRCAAARNMGIGEARGSG